MSRSARLISALFVLAASAAPTPAGATTGPGCLRVVNIAPDDMLNIRKRPTASSRVVAAIIPSQQGILHLDGQCRPLSAAWGSRWCPVSHYNGGRNDPVRGFVKARFVRDQECP